MPPNWIRSIGQVVTKRASVFTPLLTLNFVVTAFSVVAYFKADTLFVFIPEVLILLYTVWRHEQFAQKMPWMLSSEYIQKYGMSLSMGDNTNEMDEKRIEALKPETNTDKKLIAEATQVGELSDVTGKKSGHAK